MNNEQNIIDELNQEFRDIIANQIVDTEPPTEDAGVTQDVDEWMRVINSNTLNKDKPLSSLMHFNFDYEVVKNAKAYAIGPVFAFNGKFETAESTRFNSLEELKDFLRGKSYVLYFVYSLIKTTEVDIKEFVEIPLPSPKLVYVFRGCIV